MRKGFSLIELTIIISVICIFSLVSFANFANYNRASNELNSILCEDAIISIINNGKQYCRQKEKSGYVLFDMARNEVNFFSSGKRVDGFVIPKGVSIHSINTNQHKVDINKFGVTSDAGTIILRDKDGELHTITINVGAGYAEIK